MCTIKVYRDISKSSVSGLNVKKLDAELSFSSSLCCCSLSTLRELPEASEGENHTTVLFSLMVPPTSSFQKYDLVQRDTEAVQNVGRCLHCVQLDETSCKKTSSKVNEAAGMLPAGHLSRVTRSN